MSGGLDVPSRSKIGWKDETVEVEAISLDSLAEHYRAPDFVKMDIEGAEQYALRGAKTLLSAGNASWLIEIHNIIAQEECWRILKSFSYQIVHLGIEKEPPLHILAVRGD